MMTIKKSHILKLDVGGRFAINVVDNLIIVHHQASKVYTIIEYKQIYFKQWNLNLYFYIDINDIWHYVVWCEWWNSDASYKYNYSETD